MSKLTRERIRELLSYDPETGIFTWLRRPGIDRCTNTWNTRFVGTVAGSINDQGYRVICIDRSDYRAHRLAWAYANGDWPSAEIDHINGDRSDNRIANLRQASRGENMRNSRKRRDNTSGRKGVTWDNRERKWHARIKHAKKCRSLGYFNTAEAAAQAYADAARRLHGEFARVD